MVTDIAALAVVTVVLDDPLGLRRTAASLASQDPSPPWIVVDGGSGEATLNEISRLQATSMISIVLHGPDRGIYDAMNKGARASNARFLLFLNAGDELAAPDVLARLRHHLDEGSGHILLAGYELVLGSRTSRRRPRPPWYLWHGLPTSHQAILFPREIFQHMEYDPEFKVAGDYELTARAWRSGWPFRRLEVCLSRFHAGGTSSRQLKRLSLEARAVQRQVVQAPLPLRAASSLLRAATTAWRQAADS